MKNRIILLALFLSVYSVAQFKIDAEFTGYSNQPILLKIYENGSQRLLKRIETDSKGKLSYQVPFDYTGILNFELTKGAFQVIADNQDISFKVDMRKSNTVFVYNGGINQKIQQYNDILLKNELRDNTLMPLLNYYKSSDKFYQNILDEISRINETNLPIIENESVNYYLEAKKQLSDFGTDKFSSLEIVQKSKKHLINDNDNLEKFGLLNAFLAQYISNSLGSAKSREEASAKIKEVVDDLLIEAVAETPRGQNILSNAISMLNGYGFNDLANQYVKQANEMSCEMTGDLKEVLAAQNNIQVGKKAPDFELPGTKVKSLYNIKADKKLLIFWASWCPHCVNEIPFIKEFYKDFKKQGGEIIAVSLDIEKDEYHNAIKGMEWINYSDLLKWDSPIAKQYGISGTPTMILLDKNNKIIQIGSRVSEFEMK